MRSIKLTAIFIIANAYSIFAQKIEMSDKVFGVDKSLILCKPDKLLKADSESEILFLKSIVAENKKINFELFNSNKELNIIHNIYRFYYKSIPIFGAELYRPSIG